MASRKTRVKSPVIVIVGPTASGKTDLAHKLAKTLGGDIITADSRQVYKEMNIGTAKPHTTGTSNRGSGIRKCPEMRGVQHYGIDLVKPNQYFSVQQWRKIALRAISEIQKQGRVPIVEGGTWQWVYALLYNYTIPKVPPQKAFRKKLEAEIKKRGTGYLIKKVLRSDPDATAFLDLKTPRRLIRALEVMKETGKPFSRLRKTDAPLFKILILGLNPAPPALKKRLAKRLEQQFAEGLKREARNLISKYGRKTPGMSGIGYREWQPYFEGTITIDEVRANILRNTIKLAKVQQRMFRKIKKVKWIHAYQDAKRVVTQKFARL